MQKFLSAALIPLVFASCGWAITTVSFQNGINGYTSTFDRYISEIAANETDGSAVTSFALDGYNATTNSPDQQGLIRFDGIFGSGPGQIPLGATILDARLQLVTAGGASTTGSGGPFGVAGLTAPFDSNTSYFSSYPSDDPLGGRGAWWQDGHSTRPMGGYGRSEDSEILSASITPIVQQWSAGTLANHGLVVQAGFTGSDNDWQILTTGHSIPQGRPKLSVTYTTDPVTISTFQPGVNDYNGATMALVVADSVNGPEATTDGSTIDSTTLQLGDASSAERLALIKFADIFGTGAGQAPADKPVAKSWLVFTTTNGGNARSQGPFDIYAMRNDWDSTTLHSQLGATAGLQFSEGDISPLVTRWSGMATGSEVWFDVSSYVEGIRNGATDYGLAVFPRDTDGWSTYFTGASDTSLRPRLIVTSELSTSTTGPGDFNLDGKTDAADYVLWRKTNAGDAAAYNTWKADFGNTGSPGGGSSEPATLLKYDLSIAGQTTPSHAIATQAASGVTGLNLTRGPGISQSGLTNGFAANNWTNVAADGGTVDRDRAIAMGDYFQFGLALDANHTASLAELDLSLRRSAVNAPMNFEVQVSLDNFATDGTTVSSFTYFGRVSSAAPEPNPSLSDPFYYMTNDLGGRPDTVFSESDPIPTIDLSSIGLLQNLAPGTTVTFRLYAWNNGSTGSANTNTVGFRINGPRITGTVTPLPGSAQLAVPEPANAALLALAGFVFAACCRERR